MTHFFTNVCRACWSRLRGGELADEGRFSRRSQKPERAEQVGRGREASLFSDTFPSEGGRPRETWRLGILRTGDDGQVAGREALARG